MASYQKDPENSHFTPRFMGIDEAGFEWLNDSLGNVLDKAAFENGETAVAVSYFVEGDGGLTEETVRFLLPKGLEPDKERSMDGESCMNRSDCVCMVMPPLICHKSQKESIIERLRRSEEQYKDALFLVFF